MFITYGIVCLRHYHVEVPIHYNCYVLIGLHASIPKMPILSFLSFLTITLPVIPLYKLYSKFNNTIYNLTLIINMTIVILRWPYLDNHNR